MRGHDENATKSVLQQPRAERPDTADSPRSGALLRLLLPTLLALGSARADPLGAELGSFPHHGRTVPVFRIEEIVSEAPDQDAFAIELASRLNAFTAREGFEACARICRSDDGARWGATLITIGSHAACPQTRTCPNGTAPTDVDIHSHVRVERYRPSLLDRVFLKGRYGSDDWVHTDPEWFSPGDFRTGPGYMVNRRTLLFQAGEHDVRVVWRTDEGAPRPLHGEERDGH
jgi:hypothetical protein